MKDRLLLKALIPNAAEDTDGGSRTILKKASRMFDAVRGLVRTVGTKLDDTSRLARQTITQVKLDQTW